MNDLYDLYKPLRNLLARTDLPTGLGTIRWYINFIQLNNAQPQLKDLEVPREFIEQGIGYIQPWLLTTLARELIISDNSYPLRYDLRRWSTMSRALTYLQKMNGYIDENFIRPENALHFISKALPHQQFAWQENRPNYETETRYYHIYSDPTLRAIFEEVFRLDLDKYFLISLLLWNNYNSYLGFSYPPRLSLGKANITLEDYDNFLEHYALKLDELRSKLRTADDGSDPKVDETFFYQFDSLRRYPLIFTELDGQESHICPIPTYLYWRTTDGIYYDIFDALISNKEKFDQFTQALGGAYSRYIGDLLNQQLFNRPVSIIDADRVIPYKKPKPDWFLVDKTSALFIECKTKRLRLAAKIAFDYSSLTEAELTTLAEAVRQVYKAIVDAREQSYAFLQGVNTIFPMVVTMEDWHIMGEVKERLDDLVKSQLDKVGLDSTLIEKHPYTIASSAEFEDLLIVLRDSDTQSVLDGFLRNDEYKRWALRPYIASNFNKGPRPEPFVQNKLDDALERLYGQKISRGRAHDGHTLPAKG